MMHLQLKLQSTFINNSEAT